MIALPIVSILIFLSSNAIHAIGIGGMNLTCFSFDLSIVCRLEYTNCFRNC